MSKRAYIYIYIYNICAFLGGGVSLAFSVVMASFSL